MTTMLDEMMITMRSRRVARLSRWIACGWLLLAGLAGPARADFDIAAFDGQASADQQGAAFTQAAGHPYAIGTQIDFTTFTNPDATPPFNVLWPQGSVKNLRVDLPPGLVGNVTSTPQCSMNDFAVPHGSPLCSAGSQIGIVRLRFNAGLQGVLPLYNLVPPPTAPARFGFYISGVVVTFNAQVRSSGDYGVTVTVANSPQTLAIAGSSVTLWGVPADPIHDAERLCPGTASNGCASDAPRMALLRNPTACTASGVGLETGVTADSYENPGVFKHASFISHLPPGYPSPPSAWGPPQGPTGCAAVPFDPTLTISHGSARRGVPSGYRFDLALPQPDNPDGLAESDLRKAVVTLPAGVRVSASSADGLAACSEEQIGLKSDAAATCPDASKIGTATVDTPLLHDPLTGSVYLATPHANPFDSLVALYIVAKGPGVVLKLPGTAAFDAATGQITATFDNNPQLPFSKLHLELKDGSRAPLVNPAACGTYVAHGALNGWSGKAVATDSSFDVTSGEGCSPGFAPTLSAGVVNPSAGASSTFNLRLTRTDDDQEIRQISTHLPAGLLAHIGDVPRCPIDTTDCGAASQIGSVTVGAGAGPSPFYITSGKVFLTDGYQGAPFGLLIRVPAVAGPFDLGTVDVRAALNVDPITAQASVIADPLPRSLEGIPVLAKDIRVSIDRPGFMVNPTDCTPTTIAATIASFESTNADLSNRFQVGDCAALALKPKLAIALTGKGQTTDGKHPAVVAKLTQPAGQANLKKVRVELPLSLALDSTWEERNQLCEFVDGSKPLPTCKPNSIVGTAKATTPLLKQPLSGPVYFVKNVRKDPKSGRDIRTLPKLVVALTGENGLKLTLTGTSEVVNDRLVTTFDQIPDAPVTAFELDIQGGAKRGVLVISGADVCKATQTADQQIDGQNGKTADADIALQTPACPLKILGKTVGKAGVSVKVGGLGAGKITMSGKGIKKTTKTIAASTVASITARRTTGRPPGKVTVSFDPTGPTKAHKITK